MKRPRLSPWRRALTDPSHGPVVFLAGAFLAGLCMNVLSGWIGSESPWVRGGALLGVLLLLALASRSPFLEALAGRLSGEVVPQARVLDRITRSRGLVVVASRGKGIETVEAAIAYHAGETTLERLWILHSELSAPFARGLRDRWVGSGRFRSHDIVLLALSEEEFVQPQRVQEAIEEGVYGRLPAGLAERDVVLDLTGGRKTTTAGVFLAGLPPGRRLELVEPRSVDERGVGEAPSEVPMEIEIDYEVRPARRVGGG